MSNDIHFGDVIVGQELGPIDIPVDDRIITEYCEEFGDHNPIYLEDSPFGGPVVPPLFQATLHDLSLLRTKWDTHATVPSLPSLDPLIELICHRGVSVQVGLSAIQLLRCVFVCVSSFII